MNPSRVSIAGRRLAVHRVDTLVVGAGAAGLNAAVRLHDLGRTGVVIATERRDGGTSFGAGSDKQTYYKLSVAGGEPDSPLAMAEDLFAGGSMHGDIALAEAQGSTEAFFHLVRAGVPFPFDRYGGFVGYKTDHDPRRRATSAGPLTSRFMVEALGREVRRRRIPVHDRLQLVSLLTAGRGGSRRAIGAVMIDLRETSGRSPRPGDALVLFAASNIILATGGPGAMYARSVYPEDQFGAHGAALAAGIPAVNLTESQFGLASVAFRWNLSGSYQQAIPRYVSTAPDGRDEREFLAEAFPDPARLATAIFLKGYQWPFDVRKAADGGSSLVDLLVHRETADRGRRAFLDYRANPSGLRAEGAAPLGGLSPEAHAYLQKSGALRPTPFERLEALNPPAIRLFRDHGIDLARERLEIAVCAQHNNGGLRANAWWETGLRGVFVVGEACGTHGVYRPGGSALNAGQVGGLRAALFIAANRPASPLPLPDFGDLVEGQVRRDVEAAEAAAGPRRSATIGPTDVIREVRERMTLAAAHVRRPEVVERETAAAWGLVRRLGRDLRVRSPRDLPSAFRARDMALTHAVYLEAIREYIARGGRSRGSALVADPAGSPVSPALGDEWKTSLTPADAFVSRNALEVRLDARGRPAATWVPVRPIPREDPWFETVWAAFRAGRIVREED